MGGVVTVGELCDALNGVDSDLPVILFAQEPDGVGQFAELRSVDVKGYVWNGGCIQVGYLSREMRDRGHDIDHVGDGDPCVLLWTEE